MPELPEVETVRRQLDKGLRGATIKRVELLRTDRERPAGKAFIKGLTDQKILSVDRRAKLLIWRLADGRSVLAHLKMTGRFLFVDASYKLTNHDAIRFTCVTATRKEFQLIWNDMRRFGFMEVASAEQTQAKLAEYGPEPLEATPKELADRLLGPKTRLLKAALLDQGCIAGIGNIYADEACYRVGIHPNRRLGALIEKERLALAKAIKEVLQESLDQRGTSAHSYLDTTGSKGGFLSFLRVYGREGEPCRKCKTPIKKSRLVQRGTHVCPKCQPER